MGWLGVLPWFRDDNIPLMLAKIRKGTYTFYKPYFDAVSDEAKVRTPSAYLKDRSSSFTQYACLVIGRAPHPMIP